MSQLIQKVSIPEGQIGNWRISRFEVGADASFATALCASIKGRGYVPQGTYTSLRRNGRIVMSDTPNEMRDHRYFVLKARGNVLINGLGLGMVLAAVLRKTTVENVTVVEIDADLIRLVGQHYSDPRVTIIKADAFDYCPPSGIRFSAVWHDIWDDICADNIVEMTRLKRKYGRRAEWQGCWAESQCKRLSPKRRR